MQKKAVLFSFMSLCLLQHISLYALAVMSMAEGQISDILAFIWWHGAAIICKVGHGKNPKTHH